MDLPRRVSLAHAPHDPYTAASFAIDYSVARAPPHTIAGVRGQPASEPIGLAVAREPDHLSKQESSVTMTEYSDHGAAPGQVRPPHIMRLLLVALVVVAATTAACGMPSPKQTHVIAATATPTTPATTEGRLTLRVREAVGASAQTVQMTYSSVSKQVVVDITLVWYPSWRDHFSQGQAAAKLACYRAQAALWTSGVTLSKVTVIILGQALDDYASVITSAYAEADLTAQHAAALSWASLTPDTAWTRYDNNFLRPTYAPNWVYLPGR